MITSYLITGIRNMIRYRWISLISIVGLSIGLAAGLLSYLHIQYEKSYDRFHQHSDRIFRLVSGEINTGEGWVGTSAPIAPKLKEEIPEIEEFVRMTKIRRHGKVVVRCQDRSFNESNFFLADPSIFDVFDFSIVLGNRDKPLDNISQIIISKTKASKLFGDQDPIGEVVRINDKFEFTVSAVMEDFPPNSHFDLDYLISFENLERMLPGSSLTGNWGQYNYYTYLLLAADSDFDKVQNEIKGISIPLQDYTHSFENLSLQPLADIHFVHNRGNLKASYNRQYLLIYGAAALGLILISLVNFINLKTAGSSKRVKEVAVRQAMGARRRQIIFQFITETFLVSVAAIALAVLMVEYLLLPLLNDLFEYSIKVDFFNPAVILLINGVGIVISLAAGLYIAFYITSFTPALALKDKVSTGRMRFGLRQFLLLMQFTVSIFLIGCSMVMLRQMKHVATINLGLDPHQVINIPLNLEVPMSTRQLLEDELEEIPAVEQVSLNSFTPGTVNWNQTVWWPGQAESESMYIISVDPSFFRVMDLDLLEGDITLLERVDSTEYTYVLNESARNHIGWEQADGRMFSAFGDPGRRAIGGVVEDFHFQSLHEQVKPCVLIVGNRNPTQLYLKLGTTSLTNTLDQIRSKISEILPALPFEFVFVDEAFSQLYAAEQRAVKILGFYAFVCIMLALFGLQGLMRFEVNERRKEIAVRKVFGASIPTIIKKLSSQFLLLIGIAFLIGLSLSFHFMGNWLENFSYQTSLSLWIFVAAGLVVILVTFISIGYQGLLAAIQNPVESLRDP